MFLQGPVVTNISYNRHAVHFRYQFLTVNDNTKKFEMALNNFPHRTMIYNIIIHQHQRILNGHKIYLTHEKVWQERKRFGLLATEIRERLTGQQVTKNQFLFKFDLLLSFWPFLYILYKKLARQHRLKCWLINEIKKIDHKRLSLGALFESL